MRFSRHFRAMNEAPVRANGFGVKRKRTFIARPCLKKRTVMMLSDENLPTDSAEEPLLKRTESMSNHVFHEGYLHIDQRLHKPARAG